MELALEIKNNNEITIQDKAEIDKFIENAIEVHKGNSSQINKLVMDSVTALTVSEARANELESQGFFKRLWGGFTGKNQKIRADIDRNLAKSQYASQQMIQKLAEQNLLTFDTITAVNNKLNTLAIEMEEEINKIYKTLVVFFKQTRSDIIQLESRMSDIVDKLELIHWNSTIEYQMYDGVDYCDLLDIEKIACLTNDFFHLTKGNWSTGDIMLLKSTLSEIGLPVKSKISSKEFYEYLIEKPTLIDRLLKDISLDGLGSVEEYQAPLLKGVEKLSKLQGEEKYVLDTVVSQLELANVEYNKRDIQISMIHHYLVNTANIRTDAQVNMFDFVVELLSNLSMINSSVSYQEIEVIEEAVEEEKEIEVIEAVLYDESTKNERGNTNGNIINGGCVAQQGGWIYYRNTSDKNKLYRIKADGTEKVKICDDSVRYINVIGEWVYYCNEMNGMNIYKIKLNGKDRTRLNSSPSESVHVVGDSIYYFDIDEGKIYTMDSNGNNNKVIIDKNNIFDKTLNIVNETVYFVHQHPTCPEQHVVKYDVLKNNSSVIYEFDIFDKIEMMIIENGKYYQQRNTEVYINDRNAISEDVRAFSSCINVSYGDIYYANSIIDAINLVS